MVTRKAKPDCPKDTIITGAMGYDIITKSHQRYVSSVGGSESNGKSFIFQAQGRGDQASLEIHGDGCCITKDQALILAERLIQFARSDSIAGSLYS